MKIAFGKSLRCIVLISFLAWKERVCLLEVFLIQCKCCIETRFSRCSSQEFAGFTVIVCNGLNSLNMLTRQGKSFKGKFFSLCCSIKSRFTGHQEIFYVRNFLHSCIYLYLSLSIYWSILRSCNRKFVFRFWAHRQRVAVVDVIVTWKREPSQGKICVCGGLGNFSQKIFAQRKFPDKLSLYQ